jgi:hypothetical protein
MTDTCTNIVRQCTFYLTDTCTNIVRQCTFYRYDRYLYKYSKTVHYIAMTDICTNIVRQCTLYCYDRYLYKYSKTVYILSFYRYDWYLYKYSKTLYILSLWLIPVHSCFSCGSYCSIFSFKGSVLWSHYIVYPTSIYGFSVPFWHLKTLFRRLCNSLVYWEWSIVWSFFIKGYTISMKCKNCEVMVRVIGITVVDLGWKARSCHNEYNKIGIYGFSV